MVGLLSWVLNLFLSFYWGCKSIYLQLSCPFRSLVFIHYNMRKLKEYIIISQHLLLNYWLCYKTFYSQCINTIWTNHANSLQILESSINLFFCKIKSNHYYNSLFNQNKFREKKRIFIVWIFCSCCIWLGEKIDKNMLFYTAYKYRKNLSFMIWSLEIHTLMIYATYKYAFL